MLPFEALSPDPWCFGTKFLFPPLFFLMGRLRACNTTIARVCSWAPGVLFCRLPWESMMCWGHEHQGWVARSGGLLWLGLAWHAQRDMVLWRKLPTLMLLVSNCNWSGCIDCSVWECFSLHISLHYPSSVFTPYRGRTGTSPPSLAPMSGLFPAGLGCLQQPMLKDVSWWKRISQLVQRRLKPLRRPCSRWNPKH